MSAKKPDPSDSGKFENSLSRLEELVRMLEAGDLSLEDSLSCYEEGMALVVQCRKDLEQAEQRISLLTESEQGDLSLKSARADDEGVAADGADRLPF